MKLYLLFTRDIVVSQFPFEKNPHIYHLSLLTAPSPCSPLYCVVYQTILAEVLHCSYNQSELNQDLFSYNVRVIMLQYSGSVFFSKGIIV